MTLSIAIAIAWIHFAADFPLQTRWMANNKSKSNRALGAHVGIYTAVLFVFFGPLFALVNGALHFVVDYHTSRFSSRMYKEKRYAAFFNVIGLDQAVHMTCLFATYAIIGGW